MREKEGFRETMDRLSARFPGREAITITEAAAMLSRCPRTLRCDKSFPKVKISREWLVPIVGLARWLS